MSLSSFNIFYNSRNTQYNTRSSPSPLLLRLEVLHEDIVSLRLLPPVPDHNTRTTNHLASVPFVVDLAQACPLSKFLVVVHLDEVDAVFCTQGFDKLHVRLFIAVVGEYTEQCLSFVESFDCLPQPTCHAIMDHGEFKDLLNGIEDVHGSGSCCWCWGWRG